MQMGRQMERLKSVVRPGQYTLIGTENPEKIEAIPLFRTSKKSLRKIYQRVDGQEFPTSLFRFGPVYYADGSSKSAKEEAWKQVLEKSRKEQEETIECYLSAIRRVEKNARATYAGGALYPFTESQFRWMMIKDGCFFLQLALFVLGASTELGYPGNHIIFGTKQEKQVVYGWIKSMFYVGNQIPLVVLNEFMKQTFFQNVITNHGKWKKPMDLLSKGVLYDLLILPATAYANYRASQVVPGSTYLPEKQPSDLLHCLHNLVFGQRISRNESNEEKEKDEEDEEEGHDLAKGYANYVASQVVPGSTYLLEEQPSDLLHGLQNLVFVQRISRNNSNEEEEEEDWEDEEGGHDPEDGTTLNTDKVGGDNDSKERCVSGFRKKGIYFWKSNRAGIRGIQFKNRMLYAGLYLPTIPLNRDTDMLFEILKSYEECQQQNEVSSYLGLMNQLISTYEDVNHLASKGIFEVSKPQYKDRFLKMLRKLRLSETATNHAHRYVLQQLRDYSSFPWEKFKYVAILVFILTIVQAVFGVLSYVVGVAQLHQSKA